MGEARQSGKFFLMQEMWGKVDVIYNVMSVNL